MPFDGCAGAVRCPLAPRSVVVGMLAATASVLVGARWRSARLFGAVVVEAAIEPGGRMRKGRRCTLATALAALLIAIGAAGAMGAQLTVQTVELPPVDPFLDPSAVGGLAPSPDGSLVGILVYSSGIARIDASGRVRTAEIASRRATSYGPEIGAPVALANGSMAFLTDLYNGNDPRRMVLGMLPPGSLSPRFSSIPASGPYTDWDTTAIAPDGSVWRSLACHGMLSRASRGHERRIHLPRLGCRDDFQVGYGAAFAFGGDGSVWFASLCQARVVRIPLVGPRREWRFSRRAHCARSTDDLTQHHLHLLATPDGGVRFEGGRIDGRGRLVRDRDPLPDAIGSDGSEWRFGPQAIMRRKGGRVRLLPVPLEPGARIVAGTLGADGRFWYLTATIADELSAGLYNVHMHVGVVDPDGVVADQALGVGDDVAPLLVPSPDGSMWLEGIRSLLRVDAIPAAPLDGGRQARIVRVVARHGAAVWVQVGCRARHSVFCTGRVTLVVRSGRPLVRSSAELAVPAGESRAIPLTLTPSARGALRGGGLRATAVMVLHDGSRATRTVVLR